MEIIDHSLTSDTIFANASGMGGGISVIRVSGPRAIEITEHIFKPKKRIKSFRTRKRIQCIMVISWMKKIILWMRFWFF